MFVFGKGKKKKDKGLPLDGPDQICSPLDDPDQNLVGLRWSRSNLVGF